MRVSGMQAPDHRDDAALIARLRAGDQSAMADLYDHYSGVVYGVALRVLANATAAEDGVQEIFLQLWRNPQAFDVNRGRLAPWLAVIARNRAIDHLRRRPSEEAIDELHASLLASTAMCAEARARRDPASPDRFVMRGHAFGAKRPLR